MKKKYFTILLIVLFSYFSHGQTTIELNTIKDNSIYSENTSNSSGMGLLYAGNTCNSNKRRALLQFDLSTIPSEATITNVSLTFSVNNVSAGANTDNYTLHTIIEEWGEGSSVGGGSGAPAVAPDATWLDAMFESSQWSIAGGSYITTPTATQSFGISAGNVTFTSTNSLIADIQNWLDGVNLNYGWILIGNETTICTARRMGSKDMGNSPMLSITYADSLGVSDSFFNNKISIYPNPSSGIVNIDLDSIANISVEVYNIYGQLVQKESNSNSNNYQFELNGNAGMYFIKIHTARNESYYKIIKK